MPGNTQNESKRIADFALGRAIDELVMLYQQGPHMGSNMGSRMHSYPLYQDLQQRAEVGPDRA